MTRLRFGAARGLPTVVAIALASGALAGCAPEAAEGPEPRPSFLPAAQRITPQAGLPTRLTRAFPAATFVAPRALAAPPDGSGRVYVAEQGGQVMAFNHLAPDRPPEPFLDLRREVEPVYGDDGLLGLAVHPRFDETGTFVVSYVQPRPTRTVVARFQVVDGRPVPDSHEALVSVGLPFGTHRGGGVAFGSDGYLYIGIGDGGGERDPKGNAQDRSDLLGDVLRVDLGAVSFSANYAVPPDNPLVGNPEEHRWEIYASGFCDPRHLAADPATREVWVADSTQGYGEEANVLEAGGNFGWAAYAGTRALPPALPRPARAQASIFEKKQSRGHVSPRAVYGADSVSRTIGGIPYRGRRWPALRGTFVFADGPSGRLWSLHGGRPKPLLTHPGVLAAIGVDSDGELLVAGEDGLLYRPE